MTRTATFNVTLTQPHVLDVYVDYTTVSESAKSGQDFTQASGTLHFVPGEVGKTVGVTIQAISDRSLFFGLKLSNPVSSKLTTANAGRAEIKPDSALVALVNAALTKLHDYESAQAASQTAQSNKEAALATYNTMVSEYNTAVINLNNANAELANAAANVNSYYAVYQNNIAAYNATHIITYYYNATSALSSYNSWLSIQSQKQNLVNAADAAKNSAQIAKDNAYNAYVAADAAVVAAAASASSAYSLYQTAYAAAAAGFVGSTTIQF